MAHYIGNFVNEVIVRNMLLKEINEEVQSEVVSFPDLERNPEEGISEFSLLDLDNPILIERIHPEIQTKYAEISLEELERMLKKGMDEDINFKIKNIENSIFESYEEAKRDKTLKETISQLDFSTLKQIDAVMSRSGAQDRNNSTFIKPNDLSLQAVDLYIALVKRVYCGVVNKCSLDYSLYELAKITASYSAFKEKLSTINSHEKDKKFYAATEAMENLSDINKEVIASLSQELSANKEKNNIPLKGFYHHTVPKK